jgi:hypothetical protein
MGAAALITALIDRLKQVFGLLDQPMDSILIDPLTIEEGILEYCDHLAGDVVALVGETDDLRFERRIAGIVTSERLRGYPGEGLAAEFTAGR